jgi:hypothetical protein
MKKIEFIKSRYYMKTIIKWVLPIYLAFFMMSCDEMNSLHQEYLDRGEAIYTGIVDSLKAFSGVNSVRFTWEIKSDPRITKTVIYWNDGADSVVVDVVRTGIGTLQMEKRLSKSEYPSIHEGYFLFEFVTKDDKGHRSLNVEINVEIYGENYLASLVSRPIASTKMVSGAMEIIWASFDSTSIHSTIVSYTDIAGTEQEVSVKNSETSALLPGIDITKQYSVTSVYRVDEDLFNSPQRTYSLDHVLYDKTGWSATASATNPGDGSGPMGVIDGNPATWWHNNYTYAPHWLQIDMQTVNTIKSVEIHRRGGIRNINIEVSNDANNWKQVGSVEMPGGEAGQVSRTVVFDQPEAVQYIKIVFPNGWSEYLSVFEIYVYYDR